MKVFIPTLRRNVNEYWIQYHQENPVPNDDITADNLFKAVVDFLNQVGVYCHFSNRVIQFSKDEPLDAIYEVPGKCFVGEGKKEAVFAMREPDNGPPSSYRIGNCGHIRGVDD